MHRTYLAETSKIALERRTALVACAAVDVSHHRSTARPHDAPVPEPDRRRRTPGSCPGLPSSLLRCGLPRDAQDCQPSCWVARAHAGRRPEMAARRLGLTEAIAPCLVEDRPHHRSAIATGAFLANRHLPRLAVASR